MAKSEKKMEKTARIATNLKHVRDEFHYKCDEINKKLNSIKEKNDKKHRGI